MSADRLPSKWYHRQSDSFVLASDLSGYFSGFQSWDVVTFAYSCHWEYKFVQNCGVCGDDTSSPVRGGSVYVGAMYGGGVIASIGSLSLYGLLHARIMSGDPGVHADLNWYTELEDTVWRIQIPCLYAIPPSVCTMFLHM